VNIKWITLFRRNSVQPQTGRRDAILTTVAYMNHIQFTDTPNSQFTDDAADRFQSITGTFIETWVVYSATLLLGTALVVLVSVLTSGVWLVASIALLFLVVSTLVHMVLSTNFSTHKQELDSLRERLSGEASASRVLGGIRLINNNDSKSPDARLVAAARMATGYQAAVVFNLRDAHGVLAPSNWNFECDLSQIRKQFEAIDSDEPGAVAARQGSAIVMSSSAVDNCLSLPVWAEAVGFTQGIVTPISRGLDTIGVVYVFNKSGTLPTLQEIEQLELIVNFGSTTSNASRNEVSGLQNQPFRVVENSSVAKRGVPSASSIRIDGFALNSESERIEMDGMSISLSPTEFLLIHALASSPDTPVSPVDLIDRCWTKDARPADNAIDVAIFRLRKKLSKSASGKGLIKTVRGTGYMFVPPAFGTESAIVAD
jgi:DNA-binding winged helix-turn-helix (wHTH) protein